MKVKFKIFSHIIYLQFIIVIMLNRFNNVNCVCPNECHQIACTTGVLSCPDGGLKQIPPFLPPGTSKILLTNHYFLNPTLQYSNLSNYGPPQFKVVKITIQNCQLRKILPNTFSHLTDLSVLDLANNLLTEIVPDTFRSLNLNFLRLDGNRNIVLYTHSFRGLILSTLSLIDCTLSNIKFETINEISGNLKKLYLTDNNILTIDRRFKEIFEQLTVLQINGNPINCTCDLQWLSTVLRWRKKQHEVEQTPGVISEAQCHSPSHHFNKLIINLSSKDFNCNIPQLKLVDVYMTSNISARLTCTSEPEINRNPIVQWMSKSKDTLKYESQAIESAALSVWSRSKIDYFVCIIYNDNGNATVLVKIHWPGLSSNTSHIPTNFDINTNIITSRSSINSSSNNVFLHSKRFTLLEMIGGVVGTFTLTMILFLVIYRYMIVAIKKEHKKKWYISYEPTPGSDSQTYDVPHCTTGSYYTGQLFSNHNSPVTYTDFNGNETFSPTKTAVL